MRIKYIDGVKGVAAMIVFICHYKMLNFPSPLIFQNCWFSKWFLAGDYAVALFLILSGFSSWLSVQKKLKNEMMTSRIILERYFRFAVPFGIVFVVLYLTDFWELYSYHILAGELLESDVLKTVFWAS